MLLTYIWWKLFVTRERHRWEGAWGKRKRLKWDTKQRWKENHKRNVSQLPSLMIRMDRTFFITKSMGGIEGNQMENIQRIILSKRTWQLLSLMSLPGINFCLKDSEVWGNWCWVDSKQSSDLKHFQEKDLRVVFLFLSWWLLCCAVSTRAHLVLMWVCGLHVGGMKHVGGGRWLERGGLPCSWLLIWSEFALPVSQAGRQAEGPPWQRTQCKTVLSQFSPQTHHPEKPLFPTTGSPREHYS